MPEPARSNGRPQAQARSAQHAAHTDPSAEAAVLSAIMLNPAALDEVRDIVEPHDFFDVRHRLVYEAVIELDARTSAFDVVTVLHQLTTMGKAQMIGGAAFLAMITDATPSVANVADHARLVRRLSLLRRMGATLHDLTIEARAAETRGDVTAFLERCEARVFAANSREVDRDTGSSMREMMAAAAVALDPSRPREARGISTGLHELDKLSGGFQPGELWYIGARPGVGKTALALGMARAVAETGRQVVFFSLEMDRPSLSERNISAVSGVPHAGLHERKLSMAHWERATLAMNQLAQYPMRIDDDSSLTPARLRSRLRRHLTLLRAEHAHSRPGIVVVDYVQLMDDGTGDRNDSKRNEMLERISRSLKLMAGEFKITVVALSQLKRPVGTGGHAKPGLADLRGSGAFEQDADKVLLIHRDEAEGEERGDAQLILAKARNGATGKVFAVWEPWCVRYLDASQAGFKWAGPGADPNPDGTGY